MDFFKGWSVRNPTIEEKPAEPLGKRIGSALDMIIPYGRHQDGRLLTLRDFVHPAGSETGHATIEVFPDPETLSAFRKSLGYSLSYRRNKIRLAAPNPGELHKEIKKQIPWPRQWGFLTLKKNAIIFQPRTDRRKFYEELAKALNL